MPGESDVVAVMEERDRESELREVAVAQDWRRKKFDAGFGWITGPEQYGGRAERVWEDAADGPDLKRRLAGLPGFGTLAARRQVPTAASVHRLATTSKAP